MIIKSVIIAFLCILLLGNCNQGNRIIKNDSVIKAQSDIENADFSLLTHDRNTIVALNGDFQKLDSSQIIGDPILLFENSGDINYSIMKGKWKELDLQYIKFTGLITSIICESNLYTTPRGIGVGDSVSNIYKVYPKEKAYISKNKVEYDLGNASVEAMMALNFYNDGKRITKIEIMEGN